MYIYSSRAYLLPDHNSISFESLRRVAKQDDSRRFCGFCRHCFSLLQLRPNAMAWRGFASCTSMRLHFRVLTTLIQDLMASFIIGPVRMHLPNTIETNS